MKLHINWGHASASQLKRAPVDSDGETTGLINMAGDAPQQREVCRAFDRAPHLWIAATSTASPLNEKLREDILFLYDAIALNAMDMYSKNFLLVRG